MPDEIELDLVDNAVDFLREAVKHATASRPRDWKYAILHLCSALELLFKAVLEKEHWSLVFEDVDSASREALQHGNFNSVRFETALDRLQKIVGVALGPKSLKYLKRLRRLRNRSNHFSLRFNVEQVKSLVARGIAVFLDLQQRHLHETPDKSLEYEINQALQEFEKYVNERLRGLRPDLASAERPHPWFRTCQVCSQDTLVSRDSDALCVFCGESWEFSELAEYSEGSGGQCPECENGVLGFILLNNEEGRFVCARCGFETERNFNTECMRCGQEFWNEAGSPVCSDCWSQLVEKD